MALSGNGDLAAEDLLANAPCALAILSMERTIEWSNRSFQSLTGLSSPGASFLDALTPAGAIFFETLVPVMLLRGFVKEVAIDIVPNLGNRVPVFLSANVRHAADGAAAGIRIALFEATERRLYERDLLEARKSAEQMADVVRRAMDAIITLSPEGRICGWNSGAEQTFGYPAEEALGRSFTDQLFPPGIHDQIAAAVGKLHVSDEVSNDIIGLHRDGRQLYLSMRLTPHLEPPGVLVAFSAILRDVSAHRAAEQALIKSEKLASVGRLASSIAHEINNPLESVTNLLYLLGNRLTDDDARHYLRMAEEELGRVSQIVTHTLMFHKQSTARTEVNPHVVVQSVLALYKARFSNSAIEVKVRCSGARLFCYEGELRQILVNLISNAYDAVKLRGGRIEIRCKDATRMADGQRGVRILIADNGPGVHPSIRNKIFEPFVTTKETTGTGLGLWITRDLVEKNRGAIRFRTSTDPYHSGTVFSLWFSHCTPEKCGAPS